MPFTHDSYVSCDARGFFQKFQAMYDSVCWNEDTDYKEMLHVMSWCGKTFTVFEDRDELEDLVSIHMSVRL